MADFAMAVDSESYQARSAWLKRFTNRTFDLTVAVVGLLLTSWLILLLMIVVKFILITINYNRSPIFKQRRIGKNGKMFTIFKVRTLYPAIHDCDVSYLVPIPMGRFIRAWHLDELPQLFNILRGDMNLVGPRPLSKKDLQNYKKVFPGYNDSILYMVKPGLTGAGQLVNDRRIEADNIQRVFEADIKYIQHHSFFDNVKIILMTAGVLGKSK